MIFVRTGLQPVHLDGESLRHERVLLEYEKPGPIQLHRPIYIILISTIESLRS